MSQGLDAAERVRLMRDGLINCSEFLVSGSLGLLLVPFLLKRLGAQSYGLWLAALAAAGMARSIDGCLHLSVTREVAASQSGKAREETARFVAAAGRAEVGFGLLGAASISLLGAPLSAGLHLGAEDRRLAPLVFGLAGLGFFADRLTLFSGAVFCGMRRFGASNAVGSAAALLRAAGIAGLLAAGAGLAPVAAWQSGAALAAATAAVLTVGRIEPRYRLHWGRLDLAAIRPHLPYGLTVVWATAAAAIYWSAPLLLVGIYAGAAKVAQYNIAQKFPLLILMIAGRGAGALFPAASLHERGRNAAGMRDLLETGIRWQAALALPLCLVAGLIAPDLLRAWVGEAPPESILVMRLSAAAAFLDAVAAAPANIMMGSWLARRATAVFAGAAAVNICLTALLLGPLGIAGAAWALLTTAAFELSILVYMSSRAFGAGFLKLSGSSAKALILPASACAAAALGFKHLAGLGGWSAAIGAALLGGGAYAAVFYVKGGNEAERLFGDQALSFLRRAQTTS